MAGCFFGYRDPFPFRKPDNGPLQLRGDSQSGPCRETLTGDGSTTSGSRSGDVSPV